MTNRINTLLDALYLFRASSGRVSLRLPAPGPAKEQVFFIGATNVPIDSLDPALIRPGRMGRHVWFRTPTKDDRNDIFNLYLAKVAHEPDLDTDRRRDELARITNGYSPAMIEQVCSLAPHPSPTPRAARSFGWQDIVEAMTTVETGTAAEHRVHRGGDAGGGHPRGRPCRRRARLHGGARPLHAALDPQARRLARPPPGMEKDERFSHFRSECWAG